MAADLNAGDVVERRAAAGGGRGDLIPSTVDFLAIDVPTNGSFLTSTSSRYVDMKFEILSITISMALRVGYQLYFTVLMFPVYILVALILCFLPALFCFLVFSPFAIFAAWLWSGDVGLWRDVLDFLYSSWLLWLFKGIMFSLGFFGFLTVFLYFARGIRDDRMGSISAMAAMLFVGGIIHSIWKYYFDISPNSSDAALNIIKSLYLFLLSAFFIIHLFLCSLMRVTRPSRLASRAPRFGFRTIVGKYEIVRALTSEGKRIAYQGIFQHTLRMILTIIFLGVAYLTMNYFFARYGYDKPKIVDIFFLAILVIISISILVYEIFSTKYLRIFNIMLALTVLDNTFKVMIHWAIDSAQHGGLSLANLVGYSFLFSMIGLRSWLFFPFRRMVASLRHLLIRSAASAVAVNRQRPILLLRSFSDDRIMIQSSFNEFPFVFGGRPAVRPIEEIIAENLFARGPVIALADPRSGSLPPLGAARDLVYDENWRQYIIERIIDSQIIVCVLGKGYNFRWELEQVLSLGAIKKVLIVAPPSYPIDRTIHASCPIMARDLGLTDLQTEQVSCRNIRVFAFDAKRARWCGIRSLWASERAYADAIRIGSELLRC